MGNDAICLEKQGECGAMADAMPVASVEGGDSLIDGLNDKVDVLESKVELLQGTFDVWQGMINPILSMMSSILSNVQDDLQRDASLITVLVFISTIIIVVATAGITYFLSRDKKQTLKNAIADIDKKIAEGILSENPNIRLKIVGSIINTNEFKDQVVSILDKYSTLSSKSSYENIDKTDETTLDSKSLKKTDTNNQG